MTAHTDTPALTMGGVERVLCVAAHPDDLEYGISAAVAAWTSTGITVDYLLVTAGEAGMKRDPATVGTLRTAEQRDACDICGVNDLTVLDYPDGHLEEGLEIRKSIAAHIRARRPDVVVTSNFEVEVPWGINHVDHRIVGLATADAVRDADTRWIFPELFDAGLEPWSAQRLLIGGYEDERIDVYVDVTGEPLHKAIASLNAHKEYLADLPEHPKPEDFLPDMTASLGAKVGVAHACGFRDFAM